MAKVKKTTKSVKTKSKSKPRSSKKTYSTHIYGLEREFVLITGGGFLVIVLALFILMG
jgi:hypothetical protein